MTSLSKYLVAWRTTVLRDREVVDAQVQPAHQGPSPELLEALKQWPGLYYWAEGDAPGRLVLIRPLGPAPRERWWLHILLFLTTFITVLVAGAAMSGARLAPFPDLFPPDLRHGLGQLVAWARSLGPGVAFASALMAILLCHEAGHYVVARRYAINASPPYFLPAPVPPTWLLIGTLGAFIRVRSPIVDRRQLIDVGAAGPWAGLVVAFAFLLIGLAHSVPTDLLGPSQQAVLVAGRPLFLGNSMLLWLARRFTAGGGTLLLDPLAFAGWIGLFVTMLNLLPLGQLDGGHVVYSMAGKRQAWVARVMWYVLLLLGVRWKGWWVWAFITLLLGGGRVMHPSVLDPYRPLPPNRRLLGWATLALFVLTFIPVPFPGLWDAFGS